MDDDRTATYRALMALGGRGDPFDRHLFACLIAAGQHQTELPLWDFLGLAPAVLRLLLAAYFPGSSIKVPGRPRLAPESIEEEDFRNLLLTHRARNVPEEEWLAAMVARRAQAPSHLWEDLGLTCRDDLNRLLARHFPTLFIKNTENMKWKKFFYRMMCEAEGMRLCKSPVCELCPDLHECFEPESRVLKKAG